MQDRVPLIDVQAQYARLRPRIDARLRDVLEHGGFILGPEVGELETVLARLAGVAHAVGVGNGTDALLIALLAEGIGPGDAVFVPSFTFVATAGAVVAAGATPVFCDVDPSTFNLDVDDMARRGAELPGELRPRAVIPVDLFGLPADYARICDFAAAHDLLVIADAAQSFGGTRGGIPVGSLAPITATSFYPTKPLGGFGDGGAIFTDDADCAARLRAIRVHGQNAKGVCELPGLNSRLDTLQAAVLLAKLEAFSADLARRAAIAARYDEALADHVGLQARPSDVVSTHAVYAVLCDGRDSVQVALRKKGIATRVYYERPLHLMPSMRRFTDAMSSLPISEWLSSRVIGLPIYPELEDATVDRICGALLDAVGDQDVRRLSNPSG